MSKEPLEIVGRHVGHTGTRFLFSDRSYTVATDDGRTVCINRECMAERKKDCEHTAMVLALNNYDEVPDVGW